jgi:hypothetical protein
VVRCGPGLVLATTLALPASEPWLGAVRQAAVHEEIELPAGRGRALRADVYRPPQPSGALLLVHGLSRAGRRQPDLARLARALAGQGQVVLVPEFAGLAAFRLRGDEIEDVRAALAHLRGLGLGGIGIAGFSFGAGPALLAAADTPGLRLVGAFGGYADLRHVIAFITTGAHGFRDRQYTARPEAYNRWKLLALLLATVEEARDRVILEQMAERRLMNPDDDTRDLQLQLGGEGRTVLALITNRDPRAVPSLVDALPIRARRELDALSPLPAMSRIDGRLLVAHGGGDESIPFTESLRLAAAGRGTSAVILGTFHHVGAAGRWSPARGLDGIRLVGLARSLLSP